jgi:plasmid stabilization system protein ParE
MKTMDRMTVTLTPEMPRTVRCAVEAGEYASSSETITIAAPRRRLRLPESAEQELIERWSFVAADDHRTASKLVQEIEARFETVQDQPEIGPRRDRLADGLRVHFDRGV